MQLSDLVPLFVPVLDPFHAQVVLLQLGADLLCPCPQVQLIGDQALVDDLLQRLLGSFRDDLLHVTLAQLHVSSDADGLFEVEFDFVKDRFHWLLL